MKADDHSRLTRLLETYGADPHRWPEDARALHARATAQMLQAEAALDKLLALDAHGETAVSPSLRARILDAAPRPSARRRSFAGLGRFVAFPPAWARTAMVAGVLMGGTAAGYAGAVATLSGPLPEQDLLALSLTAPDDPFAAFMEDEA